MIDPQRVVDDIRSFLHASDQTFTDPLRQLAMQYTEACQEANQRLRRCDEYLQKGLRSEAIQYAQAEPVLLDLLAVLDFPERADWEQTALMYSLPPPPKLRLETAEALNQAYAEEKPLESLLRKHRRLALARASLPDRLSVLHKIWQADASNLVWEEDIALLESARFGQLRDAVAEAVAARDVEGVFQAREELFATAWHSPPPKSLLEHVDRLSRGLHSEKLHIELHRAGAGLMDAFRARNEAEARRHLEEWKHVAQALGLGQYDPQCHAIGPACTWLQNLAKEREEHAKRAAFQFALQQLDSALRSGAEREQLLELHAALLSHRRPIPKATLDLYFERMGQLHETRERRDRYILAAVFGAGTLLLLGFFIWMSFHRQ